jgi:hypothetical protein
MGRIRGLVALFRHAERGHSRNRGISALVVFILSFFVLLTGMLVAMPVREAVADTSDYGPDGYFSALKANPLTPTVHGALPMHDTASEALAVKVLFGKSGSLPNAAGVVEPGDAENASVNGRYMVLGKGPLPSVIRYTQDGTYVSESASGTTELADESVALLWASDVVTSPFAFAKDKSCFGSMGCQTFDAYTAADGVAEYESSLAVVSRAFDSDEYYSGFERDQFGAASQLEGVCTNYSGDACKKGGSFGQSLSVGSHRVFALSSGDLSRFFNPSDGYFTADAPKRRCSTGDCLNGTVGSWTRSAYRSTSSEVTYLYEDGKVVSHFAGQDDVAGFRPAFRLKLDNLLLSAHSGNQSQAVVAGGARRLTFVDSGKRVWLSGTPTVEQESDGGDWLLQGVGGSSNLESQSGFGWKLVDSEDTSGVVVASGRTNYDEAAGSDGNMVVPCETLTPGRDYLLSVWGQEDGSDVVGWSNRATRPVTGTVRADGAGGCGPLDMPVAEPFGIALTGQTSGTLTAYKIGEYAETVFTQSGALKSVRLTTPEGLDLLLKDAVVAAGGGDVDAGNPIGWVAARWLGYPTDPLSDDVTSAFSPYAGSLQLFAKALANRVSADGDAVLGGVQGSLHGLDAPVTSPVTLPVSDEGLYLIVDSSQDSGGSLPIIVGTKVFNEALGEDGGFVDFADAGVKGKPRLGQAALKTTVTDIAKRIVNDAGLDGFDVGSQVEFEVALRVPDLSSFTSVAYDSYRFNLTDVAASGLTLPVDGSGVEVFVDALSPTEPQSLPPGSIAVSGDTLTVDGLKVLFAESDGVSGVKNKNTVPAGSLMRLRYRAVLNASAVVSSPVEGESLKPNVNAVTLTRSRIGEVSNGWTDAGAGLESKAATANMYTFKLDVVKLDKDDLSTRLGGAGFEVSRDGALLKFVGAAGVYRLAVGGEAGSATVTTKADGTLSLLGVEARELSFKETTAPSGYFRVSDFTVDIRPVWNEDATQVMKVAYATSGTNLAYVSKDGEQVVVLDPAWSLANLPYTGGIGILVLLIIGGLILAFAIRPYILSKRAERDANLV